MTKKITPEELERMPAQNDCRPVIENLMARMPATKTVAKATHQVTERAYTSGLHPLQTHELRSIYALFAWVANEQKSAPETVQSMTETHFGIDSVAQIKKRDYDEVIRFLVDLRIDEMKN